MVGDFRKTIFKIRLKFFQLNGIIFFKFLLIHGKMYLLKPSILISKYLAGTLETREGKLILDNLVILEDHHSVFLTKIFVT